MKLTSRFLARLLVLAFLILMVLMFTGCKSKKKLVNKKQETVSVLEQNDIKTTDEIKLDVKILEINTSKKITISPKDSSKNARIVSGKDTLDIFNANVVIENNNSTSALENKSTGARATSNKSHSELESDKKDKAIAIEKTGTHPALIWGSLLIVFIFLLILYIRKQFPSFKIK